MSYWEEFEKCAEEGAKGTTVGASVDVVTGGATLGGGAAVGGIYGCLSALDDPTKAARSAGRYLGRAWDRVSDLGKGALNLVFNDEKKRTPRTVAFDSALLRTVWHLEHRRTRRYEVCVEDPAHPMALGKRLRENVCLRWTVNPASSIWTPANRAMLYGPPGTNTDPDLLYKGLSVQYSKLRASGDKGPPEDLLVKAIAAYGDFLKRYYPQGQRDESKGSVLAWEPTLELRGKRVHSAARIRDLAASGGVMEVPPAPPRKIWPWVVGGAYLAGAAGLGVYLVTRK